MRFGYVFRLSRLDVGAHGGMAPEGRRCKAFAAVALLLLLHLGTGAVRCAGAGCLLASAAPSSDSTLLVCSACVSSTAAGHGCEVDKPVLCEHCCSGCERRARCRLQHCEAAEAARCAHMLEQPAASSVVCSTTRLTGADSCSQRRARKIERTASL